MPESRRVVVVETQGPHAGMTRIIGYFDTADPGAVPEYVANFLGIGDRHVEFASLIKATPRYVLYRETFPRPTGRFGQTMDSWHPEQR